MLKTDDRRVTEVKPLISPAILSEELPLTDKIAQTVLKAREAAENIIRKKDDRLLVIIGPCSIHDPKAALEYAGKLQKIAQELKNELVVIMRVYFEKPRTTVGWKGLINDPELNGSFQINKGLHIGRGLLRDLNEMGLPCGVEFLDTISPQYIADLVSWGAIGARTTESQIHRELASGLSVPIGFKNGTNGNVDVAFEGVKTAANPHCFLGVAKLGISAIIRTSGNDCCHIILRGGTTATNYDKESVAKAAAFGREVMKLEPSIMIDCSHGNSRKIHTNQIPVSQDVAIQIAEGSRDIIGVMIESNLVEGNQKIPEEGPQYLRYGQSITDACLSWSQTEPVLRNLAKAVITRRTLKTNTKGPCK
jgi:3-deoxy-7-phosphoheptulonate synthase